MHCMQVGFGIWSLVVGGKSGRERKCVSWEVLNVEEGIWKGVGVIGMINVRNGSYSGII